MRQSTSGADDKDVHNKTAVQVVQQYAPTENMEAVCKCKDCDAIKSRFKPPALTRTEADSHKMQTIPEFILAQIRDAYVGLITRFIGTPNSYSILTEVDL